MNYLKSAEPNMYQLLARSGAVGTSGFDKSWKALATNHASAFGSIQHEFIKKSHYSPAASKMSSLTGIDPNKRSSALQNVVWSVGVQHGSGGASGIFKNAGISNKMSDADIIKRIYNERMKVDIYFRSSPSSTKASVKKRFANELKDALAML